MRVKFSYSQNYTNLKYSKPIVKYNIVLHDLFRTEQMFGRFYLLREKFTLNEVCQLRIIAPGRHL